MCIGSYADISIYVPTRGAIYIYAHHLNSTLISIHAPTRGATIASVHTCVQALISIHAPTRGATCETCNYCHNNRFQSTLPREEQHMNQMHIPIIHNFNPHSHERSDSTADEALTHVVNFNPRSHERSDSNIAQKICLFLYNTDNKYIIR